MEHVLPTMERTDQADGKLKAATFAFDEGAPGAVDRLTAAMDKHELTWALHRMVEKEYLSYPYIALLGYRW